MIGLFLLKGVIMKSMKKMYFENIRNGEKFYSTNMKDVMTIDGIEYLRVFKFGTQHDCLIKKDSLRKIPESNLVKK